ncbi:HNH endonuclease [Pyruvatibacter mobilis]|uniref:HNH endonuclease n=1 Tax=Pyruvatibacter mobilis TaxID=1712261 RepID=UPI003BB12F2D
MYEDKNETDDPTLVGENCHIVAESDDGPRGDAGYPAEKRNSYGNLILLCRNHHKIIDDQIDTYSVDVLHAMKREHEAWVSSQLTFDGKKQRDDEFYSGIIDKWGRLSHLDTWLEWSSMSLSYGRPRMEVQVDKDFEELRSWLLNRIWPHRYKDLEVAILNFRHVLQDFQLTFRSHLDQARNSDILTTSKFYSIEEWDPNRYQRLRIAYDFHVDIVQDLVLELTRAANLICDRVRDRLSHSYRMEKGHLVVRSGPAMDLAFHDFVVRYSPSEVADGMPYKGLEQFYQARTTRDFYFGSGTPSNGQA